MNRFNRFIVVDPTGAVIAITESMDDALDVLNAHKGFDEHEGLIDLCSYQLKVLRCEE